MAIKKHKPEYITAIRGLRNLYKFTGLSDKQVVAKIQELRLALTQTPEATLHLILKGNSSKTMDLIDSKILSEASAKELYDVVRKHIS